MKKIYLSPSSQWNNKYAYGSYTEAEICGKIAEATRVALVRNGYLVMVGSNNVSISQRINESNKWGADVHMPIHTNAGGGDGTLVMCYPTSVDNAYVKAVYEEVAKLTPTKDDGIRVNENLSEIKNTKCVCVYLECEFHDNGNLAKWIVDNVTNIGEAIARGICKADGVNYVMETVQPKEVNYTVQVGAYSEYSNAKAMAEKLRKAGFNCFIKDV